jgi:hypothetical protein
VKTLERCPHPHAFPAIECTGVRLTRSRRAPVCLCSHLKAVHRSGRLGMECGLCGCRYYETARSIRWHRVAGWGGASLLSGAFWVAVVIGVRAVTGG